MECQFNRSYSDDTCEPDETPPDTCEPDETPPDTCEPDETPQDTCEPDETPLDTCEPDETPQDTCEPDETPQDTCEPDVEPDAVPDDGHESEGHESESPKEHDEGADSAEERRARGEAMLDALIDDAMREQAFPSESSQPSQPPVIEQGDPCAFGLGDVAAGIPDVVPYTSDDSDGSDSDSDSSPSVAPDDAGQDESAAADTHGTHGGDRGRHSCKECVPVGRCPCCGKMLRRRRGG
eukprot:s2866_g2.t1